MTTYSCQKCGAAVAVEAGQVKRTCGCDAPVAANIQAHATGSGSLK